MKKEKKENKKKSPKELTKEIKKKNLLAALEKTLGVITSACEMASVSKPFYYSLLQEDDEFREAVIKMKDRAHDFVETALFKQIQDGNPACIMFYLKCQCKHRGYVEKTEIEHSGKVESVQFYLPDNGRDIEKEKTSKA